MKGSSTGKERYKVRLNCELLAKRVKPETYFQTSKFSSPSTIPLSLYFHHFMRNTPNSFLLKVFDSVHPSLNRTFFPSPSVSHPVYPTSFSTVNPKIRESSIEIERENRVRCVSIFSLKSTFTVSPLYPFPLSFPSFLYISFPALNQAHVF